MPFFNLFYALLIGSFFSIEISTLQANIKTDLQVQERGQGQKNSIKAIIFDCDGTLVDNGIAYFLDWQHAFKCQGYDLHEEEFWDFMRRAGLVGTPGVDGVIVKYLCELLGCEYTNEILTDKKAFSKKLHQTYEFPAIGPTIDFLHALGKEKEALDLKIGLASANSKENIFRVLKRLNIEHYFDAVVSAEDLKDYIDPEGTNKPKPYIYRQAAKLLGLCPAECVAIEDSKTGVSSAVNAGCITIAIPNNQTVGQDLSHAHLKLISLQDITPKDFLQIIDTLINSM